MAIPIICFDLDGTLLDGKNQIHPNDLEILKNNREVLLVPCTGRPIDSVEAMFHANGLFQDEALPLPVITQNGSSIHLPGGEVLEYASFPKAIQDQLISIFQDFPQASYMLMEKTQTVLLFPNDLGIYWLERFSAKWTAYTREASQLSFGKATCLSADSHLIRTLAARLKDLPLEAGLSLSSVFDINPQGISKRTGILNLMQSLQIEDAPIYVAGDGENDLDLFKLAKVSFSPVTSTAAVKNQADVVVDVSSGGLLSKMIETAFSFSLL